MDKRILTKNAVQNIVIELADIEGQYDQYNRDIDVEDDQHTCNQLIEERAVIGERMSYLQDLLEDNKKALSLDISP